jgi:hypothetical protein
MEYGTLIRQAWTITWRYRFLWLLGVLAGGAVGMPTLNGGGSGTGWRADSTDIRPTDPSLVAAGEQVGAWAVANAGSLIALAVAAVALMLVLLVLSFIAQGSMGRATADIASGRPSSLGSAWGAGVHLFWRYVGLWLVLIGAAIAIAAIIGAVVAAGAAAAIAGQAPWLGLALALAAGAAIVVGFMRFVLAITRDSGAPRWLVIVGSALFALPIFTVLIAAALLLSIVVAFAQRAIAVEDAGPIAALQSGWRLTRAHLGDSLLTWLVNVGLALATGIAVVLTALGALVLLAGIGGLVFAVVGLTGPLFAYIGVGGLVLTAGVLTLAGIANTFFWAFWTLAYFRLSGRSVAATIA